jgi:hypothetical protein
MAKLSLGNVANLLGSPTAAATVINQNSDLVEAAFENTLSRDGTSPNQMLADLDMNHNDILNARIIQVEDLIIDGTNQEGLLERAEAAVVAAEIAAANAQESEEEAEYAANIAKKNFKVSGPYIGTGVESNYGPLSGDPGNKTNTLLFVDGVYQMKSYDTYDLVYVSGLPYIRTLQPVGQPFEVMYGSALEAGIPIAGSVTPASFASFPTATILGRVAAGTGLPTYLTMAELRDNLLPMGSVISSAYHEVSAGSTITTVIPLDGTVPQITEGSQINTLSITPKDTRNLLKVTWSGDWAASGLSTITFAAFSSTSTDAIKATCQVEPTANYFQTTSFTGLLSPNTVSPVTISVRGGVQSGGTSLYLGDTAGGGGYGGHKCTLYVEEIKGY